MDVERIRGELLHSDDTWMRARRKIAVISAFLASEFSLLGMRQYGAIRRLPDVPLRGFDANAITTSRAAYPLGVPDSALAVIGAGTLIALATAGGTERSGRSPWLDLALGAGVLVGCSGALLYAAQMVKQRRACVYCLAGTAGFLSLVPLSARGVARAWRTLRGR